MEIKPDMHPTAKIVVVGVGGSGQNALNRMVKSKLEGITFIGVNTDAQALHYSQAPHKVHIGTKTTRGLGAGANPEIGKKAAEEDRENIRKALEGADMVFITCGMGGGTGTGATPVIADVAREVGALVVGVVTKPFAFEGARRTKIADQGWQDLKDRVDTLITIPNDKLLSLIDRKTSIIDAFEVVDDVLLQGVQGISDLITQPGLINVDFADVKTVMKNAGSALMGIGYGTGENRAAEAAKAAIDSPLLDTSIQGAKGLLVNITGGSDLSMIEVDEAMKIITETVDPEAMIIFGAVVDDASVGEIKITVIATGFEVPEGGVRPDLGTPMRRGSQASAEPGKPGRPKVNFFGRQPGQPATPAMPAGMPGAMPKTPAMPSRQRMDEQSGLEDSELDVPAFIRKKMK